MTDLGTLGGIESYAWAINNAGQVVGWASTSSGERHAFLYSKGTMTDLGVLPGGTESFAQGINNAGQVVGYAYTSSGEEHAFLYSDGTMTDLGTLGGNDSLAESINNAGQVVGVSATPSVEEHAFLYSDGTMTDLGTLLEENQSYTQSYAWAINNAGQVVGSAADRAFLLTPVPEGIAACNGITLSGNVMVNSYNSTKGSYASQLSGGHAGSDGNVQTLAADANITLSGNAAVYGNASATGSVVTSGHAEVYGTTSQKQPVSVCDPLNVASVVEKNRPSGSPTSITLSGKQTQTLFAPNTFYLKGVSLSGQSMLTVNGTGNATMFIDGDLSIAGQASFNVSTGIILTIYITGNISMAGGGIVNQGLPTDLIIYASAEKGKQIAISGNADLGGVLYAPFSNISAAGNAAIMGEVWGMTVAGSGNAGFHYDEATMLPGW